MRVPGHPSYGWTPGILDEVRISDIARGADWLATTFNFTDDPNAYLSFGAQQIVLENREELSPWLFG